MSDQRPKPVILMVLDGWGIAPPSKGNAITLGKTPTMDNLVKSYPAMTLQASGEAVGLSWGEIGNSEVGHLNLGSGKLVYQNLPRIDKSIADGDFYENEAILKAVEVGKKSNLHLMGLLSSGGVHGSAEHLNALLDLCAKEKVKNVYLHLFLDGRDMPYNSGLSMVEKLEKKIEQAKVGKIATLAGRFFAMDRDNHWERVVESYNAMVKGEAKEFTDDPKAAIQKSYDKKVYDEEFVPTIVGKGKKPTATIADGDAVIFFNFRSDRARQLSQAFVVPNFDKFECQPMKNLLFVGMTEYSKDLKMEIAFPPEIIDKPIGKVIEGQGLNQLHVAETEKYAHVTFFFNGGVEVEFKDETRELVPSPRVESYAEKPDMSAKEITKKTIDAIMADKYDFIVLNFANGDMVAHTGDLQASIKAVEVVDDCVKQIIEVVLAKDGVAFITADHGNAEELLNLQTGEVDKEHSTYPVPFIVVGKQYEGKTGGAADAPGADLSLTQPSGILSDIAPTILKVMNIEQPPEMTGQSLI